MGSTAHSILSTRLSLPRLVFLQKITSNEKMHVLPHTKIPCFYPRLQVGRVDGRISQALTASESGASDAAFAVVLRTLLGGTGEFAFCYGSKEVVCIAGIEDGQTTEVLSTYDTSEVHGLDRIEAKLSIVDDQATPLNLEKPIAFHLEVRPSSITLAYSGNHVPESFARQLLRLYLSEVASQTNHIEKNAPAETLSVLGHPPQQYSNGVQKYNLLHDGFLYQVSKNPNAIAVDFLGSNTDQRHTLTYAELGHRSLRLAQVLRSRGKPNGIVPFALPPSVELYVAYLGILRSGNAFCPLPGLDNAPPERLVELVQDLKCTVVLGCTPRPSWMELLPDVEWINITVLDNRTRSETWTAPNPTDLAYILFTSGSTGKPKGVEITHQAVSASIASHLAIRPLAEDARWFQFAAATFDPSLMEIFINLWSGTTLCAADRQRFLTDPEGVLRELRCSHMMATPSMAAMLRPEKIGSKFELWTMGEKLSDSVIDKFSRPAKDYVLCNAYGPTEASINVTLRIHTQGESGARLGPPIPTAAMVILHPTENRLVPMGFPGELGLAGVQLARGYLNMPEQTARAFVDVEKIGRVYRTGDRARVVVDEQDSWNCVEYLGRMGMEQVKLSGRRVELGEIDSVISAVVGISAAHAAVVNGQLYALLTPADDDLVVLAQDAANTRLQDHMRPVAYFPVDSIPKSAAGKADRRAITNLVSTLLAATALSSVRDHDVSNVDSQVLARVVKLVSSAADIDERAVTPNATLLTLGIDSLRGVKFLRLARDEGIDGLEIQDLLGKATPLSVASLVAQRRGQVKKDITGHHATIERFVLEATPSVRRELGLSEDDTLPRILPATPRQASVLAMYLRATEHRTAYLHHSIYTLSLDIDLARFKRSWEEVVRRNAIMRTAFVLIDDSNISPFAQVVQSEIKIDWVEDIQSDVDALVRMYLHQVPERISLRTPSSVAILANEKGTDVRFALTMHHSIFDGGSLALMLEELFCIYNDSPDKLFRAGFEHAIADALNSETTECADYWANEMLDFSPDSFPDLSGLRQEAKPAGHHVSTVMSSISFSEIRETARGIDATPLAVVQAAWGLLLLTYSESESPDIAFGSIIGGRTTHELEHTVGPVFSMVPVRLRDAEHLTTSALLSYLVEKNVSSLQYRHPPVKVLSGENGMIYDTNLALQNFGQGFSQTKLWTQAEYPPMETEFAIALEIWVEQDDSVRLRATCSNNVLIPSASEAMLRQFEGFMLAILSGKYHDTPILNILSSIQPTLLSAINPSPTPAPIPEHSLIQHQFEENCRVNPEAIAIWYKQDLDHPERDIRWTYRELNARANRLANYLVDTFGDLRDQAIPLCMEKTPELYVAIIGVVKAGAAWCPVDSAAPEKRKQDLLSRAGGPVVIVRNNKDVQGLQPILPDGLSLLALDDPQLVGQSEETPSVDTQPHHLAYLIWTSGTTGLPKGVPIEHKAAAQGLAVLQVDIPFKAPGVRCLNFSAYTFDVSILDVWYALGAPCGTLCSSTKDLLFGQFVAVVKSFEVTHAFLTPAFMAQYSLDDCPSLQSLISIGEKLPDSVADKWSRPGVVSLNTYGPAEATIIATYRRFQSGEATKAQNVGLPIQTISCFVIKDGHIVPRGGVGELALGGYQNARGYHRQPDMTAKKFITHPIGGQLYLTGDIVRILHDGTCEFVGRNDDLIKLGGIRVELSEISAPLKDCHPLTRDAVTMQLSRPDRPQKVLCTFLAAPSLAGDENVRLDESATEIVRAARVAAEEYLPAFMQPTVILVVKVLPLTPSNKVDRKALGDVYTSMDISRWESATENASVDSSTWSDVEIKIRSIVSELIGTSTDRIQKTTPFPALGVDSLRALQVASRLRKAEVIITVQDILANPTIAKLARLAEKQSAPSGKTIRLPLSSALQAFDASWRPAVERAYHSVEHVLPCTPLQEGMLGETVRNPAAYWSHRLFPLRPTIDVGALHAAWENVAHRTEMLRAVFVPAAAYTSNYSQSQTMPIFLQVVLTTHAVQFNVEQCQSGDIERRSKELATTVVKSWTDSSRPPWNVTIFKAEDGQCTMMLSMHHSLYDGNAVDYILDDVQLAYNGKPLPQRASLSEALSVTLFANDAEESQSFWEETLTPFADPDSPPWPTLLDRMPSPADSKRFFSSAFTQDRAELAEVATHLNVSISHLLQAAWSLLLSTYMGTGKVVFGETLSLRTGNASLEGTIAPLITTSPVIALITEETTPRTLITDLSELSVRATPHRLVTSQKVRNVLQRPIDLPVFPAIFVMYIGTDDGESLPALSPSEMLWTDSSTAALDVEHPLAVNVYVDEKEIKVDVLGNGRETSEEQTVLLAQQFEVILHMMMEKLDVPCHAISLSLDERFLSVLRPTGTASRPLPSAIHWLEHWATVTPDRIAFVTKQSIQDEGKTWTFKALDEASNRIASWISQSHASAIVAFCMPKSHASIAYQLGIFKSGNTYVPIDHSVSATRKRLIVRATAAVLVLTTAQHISNFVGVRSRVVDIEDRGHVQEISAIILRKLDVSKAACLLFSDASDKPSKACVLSIDSLSAMVDGLVGVLPNTKADDRFLNWMPLSLDLHLTELFLPLRLGTSAMNLPQNELPDNVVRTINEAGITHAILPSAWLQGEGVRSQDVPKLRCALVLGHYPNNITIQQDEKSSNLSVLSLFGFTETSGIFATHRRLPAPTRMIGALLAPYTGFVMRSGTLKPAMRGEIGELYISGDPMFAHYLRKTRDSVIETVHGRLWNTGILARVLANNTIQHFDYGDDLLVDGVKGSKVSQAVQALSLQPLNMHSMSMDHPQEVLSYTVTFVSRSWNPFQAQYASINEIDSSMAISLQTLCRKRNSRHSPDIVIPLDMIPLAHVVSGRPDTKALRRLFVSLSPEKLRSHEQKKGPARPLGPTEEKIRSILSSSTGIPESAIHSETSTLELGVDSLTAISLSFRLKASGFLIPPHVILAGPTLETLAKSTQSSRNTQTRVVNISADQALMDQIRQVLPGLDVQHIWRALPLQEGLVARTLNSVQPIYVNHFTLRLGAVDPARLRTAFNDTICANDILRTCFFAGERNIYQVVLGSSPLKWNIVDDLVDDPIVTIRSTLPSIEEDVVANIGNQPPIRLSFYSAKDGPAYVVLTMHHALYDGESLPMLLSEVRARYEGSFNVARPPISRLLDYVYSRSEEAAQAFFVDYLQDAPTHSIVTDVGNGVPVHHEVQMCLTLSELERTSRALNLNVHMLLMTAFGVALGELHTIPDPVFGVVLSGRAILVNDIDTMLVPCITTVPVRVRTKASRLFVDITHQCQAETTSVFEYQHTSLRHIQRWLGSESLFNTLFSFTKGEAPQKHGLWSSAESKASLDYPMAVAVEANTESDVIILRAGHVSSFLSSASMKRLLSRMEDLLRDPHQTVRGQTTSESNIPKRTLPSYSDTWTAEELFIQGIVVELCEVETHLVAKETPFVQLGIDSITSIRLAQRLRDEGFHVPAFAVMQNPCVGALAQFLRINISSSIGEHVQREYAEVYDALQEKYLDKIPLLAEQDTITGIFPATPLQTGMLVQSISQDGDLYTVHHALRLGVDVSTGALRKAWETVIDCTDILRCSFIATDDTRYPWIGAVHRLAPIKWQEYDVSSDEELKRVAQRIEKTVAFRDETSFRAPPTSFHLVRAPNTTVLIAVIHHCLYDGMSISYILEDVATAYQGLTPAPRPQFTTAVPYILQSSQDTDSFWQQRLSGFTPCSLPKLSGSGTTTHLARTEIPFPSGSLDCVRNMGVTVQAIALLAWGKILATLTSSIDVVFGQVVAGRSIEMDDSLRASGPLFNTIPFRFTLSDPTWSNAEAAQAQHEFNIQSEPRQHTPLRQIQRDWRMEAACGDALFDTLFVFQQGAEHSEARAGLWSAYRISEEASSAQYPVNIEIIHSGNQIQVRSGCRGDVLSQEGLQSVVNTFRDAFLNIVHQPDVCVTAFPPELRDVVASPSPNVSVKRASQPISTISGRHRSTTEQTLCTVFSLVTNVPAQKIGLDTPLYALGLDSVAAIQVAARCRSEYGLELSVADIFVGETISGIATAYDLQALAPSTRKLSKVLVSDEERNRALNILGVDETLVESVLPVLAGQHYHLAAWLKSGGTSYQPVFTYKIGTSVDVKRLHSAWEQLKVRHSILRTAFVATSPSSVIQVAFTAPGPSSQCDWSVVEFDGDFHQHVTEQVQVEYLKPSDLYTPPARATLVRVGQHFALLLSLHHATYDAWSVPQMIADLTALYEGSACKSVQTFSDFVQHVHDSTDEEAQNAFWQAELAGSVPTLVARKHDVPELRQSFVRASEVVISADSLNDTCQAAGASLQAAVLAAWGRIANRLTLVDSPIIGVYHTGRASSFEALDILAGPCVNVLPMQIPAQQQPGDGNKAARYIQEQLGKRTRYEQSDLRNLGMLIGQDGPLFNIFVNLLWHGDKIRSIRRGDSFLESYSVGVPSDYLSNVPFEVRSSVNSLDCSYVPDAGIYVDVVLNAEKNALGLAIKCNARLMDELELEGLVSEFEQAVRETIAEMV